MATSYKAIKGFARLSSPAIRHNALSRGLRSSASIQAAQNFKMPAMSPTMTGGNIASWKVNEGTDVGFRRRDSFSTGDVLLEIETDKTQMDVEAQDDGQLAKITQQAGTKGVKVGTRIAVIAEAVDDLSTLPLPTEEFPSPQDDTSSGINPAQSSEAQAEAPTSSRSKAEPTSRPSGGTSPRRSLGKPQKQRYPLYPSIAQLLHEKNIPISEADRIPASGPKGRLLKGDVLAYLGRISSSYPSNQSARISKLGRLDLSNIKPTPPRDLSTQEPSKPRSRQIPEPEIIDTEIAIPISLSSVLLVQKRIQATLGVEIPFSTFISRATELANNDLPHLATTKPTADELFNDILGLNKIGPKTAKGGYMPQITALPAQSLRQSMKPQKLLKQPDVYDILTDHASLQPKDGPKMPSSGIVAGSKTDESTNVFSVSAAKGEEKRARMFLERIKTILQIEPGRLIL